MNHGFRQLLAPSRVWLLATLLALAIIVAAAVLCPGAETPNAVDNTLIYANGTAVSDGRWSVFCIDGISYLEISSPRGYSVVPKLRKNGLVARCELPAAE